MPTPSRRTFAVAALAALVLPLSACGSSDDGSGSTDASGKVEGDITFQTWNLRANFKPYFDGLIADFEKKYPGTHVKWIDQPAEGYADKLSADAAGGTLPDVVKSRPTCSPPWSRRGSPSTSTRRRPSTGPSTSTVPGRGSRYRASAVPTPSPGT